MRQLPNYGDSRQTGFCAYCGCGTETKDHVPSKVFLDKPYPANLPSVFACQKCNEGFSLDEEYVACLIECARSGSVQPDRIRRTKIRRILERKPTLVSKFRQARQAEAGGVVFSVEVGRVRNVVLKLARGHAVFELNEPQFDNPSTVSHVPLLELAPDEREEFEIPPVPSVSPEVGSRASQRLLICEPRGSIRIAWITVQPGRYRYLTSVADRALIRMVIDEYLACEVVWDHR